MPNKNKIILSIATALLMNTGELAISDIENLPLVDSDELALAIALSIYNRFDVEWDKPYLRMKSNELTPRIIKKSTNKNKIYA